MILKKMTMDELLNETAHELYFNIFPPSVLDQRKASELALDCLHSFRLRLGLEGTHVAIIGHLKRFKVRSIEIADAIMYTYGQYLLWMSFIRPLHKSIKTPIDISLPYGKLREEMLQELWSSI